MRSVPIVLKRLLPFCLALSLSGCIDIDVTMDFKDAETVAIAMETTMDRAFFDMIKDNGGGPCDGVQPEIGTDEVRCTSVEEMTIEALFEKQAEVSTERMEAEAFSVVERLDDNRLRVTLDLTQMMKERPAPDDMEGMDGMADMVKAAMAGRDFVFRIRGHAIEETTGTLSEDGREAVAVIPMVTFLDDAPDFGPAFVTVVRLEEDCVLWVFCS